MTGMSKHSTSEVVAKNVYLLTKILLQLPAKSLVRFKCVSKHWLSLISDSEFSNNYTLKKTIPAVTGLYLDSHPLINFETNLLNGLPKLDFLANSFRVKPNILHSCNGLMLCFCGPEMVVCNLTTQKFKVILLLARHSKKSILDIFLAFYSMRSPHYKIVLVSAPFSTIDCTSIDIYSSESGIWKNIRFGEPLFNESQFNLFIHGVLCDGTLYWAFSVNNLVRFDIDEENLKIIPLSFEPHILSTNIMYFGEYGAGRLFLAQTSTPKETEFRIFEMDMQKFRWNIKYDMKLEPVIDTFYHISNHHSVNLLCFKRGDEEETPTLLFVICEKIYFYNPESNSFKILEDIPDDFDEMTDFELLRAHSFIESLASP